MEIFDNGFVPDTPTAAMRLTEIGYHRRLNRYLVYMGVPGFVCFAILHAWLGDAVQAMIYGLLVINALIALWLGFRITVLAHLVKLKRITAGIAFGLLGLSLVAGLQGEYMAIFFPWVFLFPMLITLFFGRSIGLWCGLGFCLVMVLTILVVDLPARNATEQTYLRINSVFALICMLGVAIVAERVRTGVQISLLGHHRRIAQSLKTTEKHHKREIDHFQEQLRQKHKLETLGSLAGAISHDFNNILSIVKGNADLIREDLTRIGLPERHPVWESLADIDRTSRNAMDVIQQLLTFSRTTEFKRTRVSLGALVRERVVMLRAVAPKNIIVRTRITEPLWPVRVDSAQITQVLLNLFVNALQAMHPNPGRLTITVANHDLKVRLVGEPHTVPPGRYVTIGVEDTGSGVPAELRQRIFEPYFTTRPVGKNSGLGLAVVHGIVERHAGYIRLPHQPGRGGCFKLYFPAVGQSVVLGSRNGQ